MPRQPPGAPQSRLQGDLADTVTNLWSINSSRLEPAPEEPPRFLRRHLENLRRLSGVLGCSSGGI